ncbi:hypothetical protein RclHR1_09200016 [Rhizophagus clarus]|uniref:Uncharacterized protein n=1 Tax=Rhizophagus clarus TaxID=94130 RepID=A0A2Z6S5X7_9GLOM|nr:hypothetical protein RclHR1_09200016 [Rhizophagus clarus]GES75848.1 hypothetical protein RCL_e27847_RclHR1_09200016 [Rhizophagus clarus]
MKKGFLLSKPAPKIAETSSSTKVTPTTALKSIPSDRFHDVIIKFMKKFVEITPSSLLCSLIPTYPEAMESFCEIHEDKLIPLVQLAEVIDFAGCSPIQLNF